MSKLVAQQNVIQVSWINMVIGNKRYELGRANTVLSSLVDRPNPLEAHIELVDENVAIFDMQLAAQYLTTIKHLGSMPVIKRRKAINVISYTRLRLDWLLSETGNVTNPCAITSHTQSPPGSS